MKKKVTKTKVTSKAKITTGVPGLDKILKGGIRPNNSLLISGGPGTGKSILTMQFLEEGAKKKEAGLALLYDDEEEYLNFAETIGINLQQYVKSGLITIIKQPVIGRKIGSLILPLETIRRKKIKRVILDSLTMYSYLQVAEEKEYRKEIIKFLQSMKEVTFLATAESTGPNLDDNNFRTEDFLFDGVIFLTKVRQESTFERVLHVSKMRGQEHLMNLYPFTIKKGGITVYPDQLPFSVVEKGKGKFE